MPSCHLPVSLIPVVGATAVVGTAAAIVRTTAIVAWPIISSVAVITIPIGGGSGDGSGGTQYAERNARTIAAVVALVAIIADINYRRWSRIIDSCHAR
jgi:hypothetical protein